MIKFNVDDLIPVLVEVAAYSSELLLVNDDGLYLICNDGLMIGQRCKAAYAEGCDPDEDVDCHANVAKLVGEDLIENVITLTPETWSRIMNKQTPVNIESGTISFVIS